VSWAQPFPRTWMLRPSDAIFRFVAKPSTHWVFVAARGRSAGHAIGYRLRLIGLRVGGLSFTPLSPVLSSRVAPSSIFPSSAMTTARTPASAYMREKKRAKLFSPPVSSIRINEPRQQAPKLCRRAAATRTPSTSLRNVSPRCARPSRRRDFDRRARHRSSAHEHPR
jgi:hypothetical protein